MYYYYYCLVHILASPGKIDDMLVWYIAQLQLSQEQSAAITIPSYLETSKEKQYDTDLLDSNLINGKDETSPFSTSPLKFHQSNTNNSTSPPRERDGNASTTGSKGGRVLIRSLSRLSPQGTGLIASTHTNTSHHHHHHASSNTQETVGNKLYKGNRDQLDAGMIYMYIYGTLLCP